MVWAVEIGDEFEAEFLALDPVVRDEIHALSRLLRQFGPQLGRPRVDTLNGSRHKNMKELRFAAADGESPLPSIPSAELFCWWRETRRGEARSDFIDSSSQKPITDLTLILSGSKNKENEPWRKI